MKNNKLVKSLINFLRLIIHFFIFIIAKLIILNFIKLNLFF